MRFAIAAAIGSFYIGKGGQSKSIFSKTPQIFLPFSRLLGIIEKNNKVYKKPLLDANSVRAGMRKGAWGEGLTLLPI